nr:T9SS type A sorting domain-containing protein [Saprospiraceae bacterium]
MKTIFISLCMLSSTLLCAQLEINFDVNFTAQYGQEYQPLDTFVDLTEGLEAWDYNDLYEYEFYELSNPLIFPGFGDRPMKYADLGAWGDVLMEYYNWPDDPYDLFLIAMAMDYPVLSPLNDENNEDQGQILLQESDGKFSYELRNVALEEELEIGNGELVSRINLLIEIYYDELCVQINYGSSVISSAMEEEFMEYMPVGVVFGWFYEENIGGNWDEDYLELVSFLSGEPSNPQFHQIWIDEDFDEDVEFLNGFPEEGTVYRFCFEQTTSVNELAAEDASWSLYPNPVSSELTLILPEFQQSAAADYLLQLMDVQGKVLLEKRIGSNQPINIESLPPGLYFARVSGDAFSGVKKVVKK